MENTVDINVSDDIQFLADRLALVRKLLLSVSRSAPDPDNELLKLIDEQVDNLCDVSVALANNLGSCGHSAADIS